MPLSTESLDESSLNLTPMIDIVFLLIIFFMVGARFSEIEQKFDIELPRAAPVAPMSSLPDPMVIHVSRTGTISIGSDVVTKAELQTRLKGARDNWEEQSVLIRGDGETMYQSVIDIMDTCRQVEIHRFSLAFQPAQDARP